MPDSQSGSGKSTTALPIAEKPVGEPSSKSSLPGGVAAIAVPAARPSTQPQVTPSTTRRRTLFGRTDRDVVLVMYAEGWRQKIEMNASVEPLKEAKTKPHVDPLVTVGLRHDGSVESVTFNRSSGVAEIDDAIRLIVQKFAPYNEFPPDMAREYDVIEIRRVWTFDTAVRLFSGGR